MILEYVLLLSVAVMISIGTVVKAPRKVFQSAGASLGARLERELATGYGGNPSIGWAGRTKPHNTYVRAEGTVANGFTETGTK